MRSSRAACVRVYGCGFCGPMVVMEVMEGWAIGRSMWLLTVQHHESWSQIVANSLHDVNCKAVVLPPPYMQYTCRCLHQSYVQLVWIYSIVYNLHFL